ncbi:MAG TPA: 4'-phosphopantetheinyl transferase superfamily protein [Casimicrobiaceae bacterium]|nr:4'-phosphopantetheinyl transferase superfamily protein [Casimicrobiaceae bacterium]
MLRRLVSPTPDLSIWWCSLEDALWPPDLPAWHSASEKARAARFSITALSTHYMRGRAALRLVLGGVLGCSPAHVDIRRGKRGRPFVPDQSSFDFNVSHTRNVALIAVTRRTGHRIGVDVEHEDRRVNHARLAQRVLTAAERRRIAGQPEDDLRRSFLRVWTAKEAMSKATGDGLRAPMRQLDVELSPTLRLLDGPPPYEPHQWQLHGLEVPNRYLATLAVWER